VGLGANGGLLRGRPQMYGIRHQGRYMKTKLDHIIREHEESDINFIRDSFMRSYVPYEYKDATKSLKDKSRLFKLLPRRFVFDGFRFMLNGVIYSNDFAILVAADPCLLSNIYGYVIVNVEESVIPWMFVKEPCRRCGVGTGLIEAATDIIPKKTVGLVYTTKVGNKFFKSLENKIDKQFKQIDVVIDYA
jgi:hypothetical protein